MAVHTNFHPTQTAGWAAWVASRPKVIRDMIDKFNLHPTKVYLLKTSGLCVLVHSLQENGTISVNIVKEMNPQKVFMTERSVFGINPADLEECDLPESCMVTEGEPLSDEELQSFLALEPAND